MALDSEVAICTLLPDVLGTYSDTGNATVLYRRLRWRSIPARILRCTSDEKPPTGCDIYVLGGGEDTAQLWASKWLRAHSSLSNTLRDRALTLAVCAGMQIFGRVMTDVRGRRHAGAEILDITTTPGPRRAIGEIVTRGADVGLLTGFENHQGHTLLGPGVEPLGRVLTGVGNGDGRRGRCGTDGVRTEHVIATYLHGPVLARNPDLADLMLSRVTGGPLVELDVPDHRALRETYLGASRTAQLDGPDLR